MLEEVQLGTKTKFTVTRFKGKSVLWWTRPSERKNPLPPDEDEKKKIEDYKMEKMESKKSVTSPRMLAYVKFQQVELKPPTGSPWRVQMTGHQYEALHSL